MTQTKVVSTPIPLLKEGLRVGIVLANSRSLPSEEGSARVDLVLEP